MSKGKVIDYLNEDPEIPQQKYALISIVGPNMKQKCDVWGLKIRGVANSLETAKALTKKIMRIDKDYDIYTVDVGKFFPLAVEPYDIGNVEYENEQLNALVKNYLANKEQANEHWHQRKNEMMKEALREGQAEAQEELANRKEHPIAVLQRITNFESKMKELTEQLDSLNQDLKLSKEKYNSYTQEEKELADRELRKAIESNMEVNESSSSVVSEQPKLSIEEIRNEIMNELKDEEPLDEIANILTQLKKFDDDIRDIETTLDTIDKKNSPTVFNTLSKQLLNLHTSKNVLKEKLNDTNTVNKYINSNYQEGKHDTLFN